MNIFWFRRDLRLTDNTALRQALSIDQSTLPVFIFDINIIDELEQNDPRISFIYEQLEKINHKLAQKGAGLIVLKGDPEKVFKKLIDTYPIKKVYFNKDYEPYALDRDQKVEKLLKTHQIQVLQFKDHVLMEPDQVLKADGLPYTVFTPYKNAWMKTIDLHSIMVNTGINSDGFYKHNVSFPSLKEVGFTKSNINVQPYELDVVNNYHINRNIPSLDATSRLGPHLRFGTISIRQIVNELNGEYGENDQFLFELIWREFFIQILYHFPHVIMNNFRAKYNDIQWRNNEAEFERWCNGTTGYPMVDAGMRQLNKTGYMHNRVRMVTAGFLCKHLLIDWRWGEAYFASKLLDFELSSNNGNWQWAAGTGCDAAPYFRVFNPTEQIKKFDPDHLYIQQWIKELNSLSYPSPIVDHKTARERALTTYKKGLMYYNTL